MPHQCNTGGKAQNDVIMWWNVIWKWPSYRLNPHVWVEKDKDSFCVFQAEKALQGIGIGFALHFFCKDDGFCNCMRKNGLIWMPEK